MGYIRAQKEQIAQAPRDTQSGQRNTGSAEDRAQRWPQQTELVLTEAERLKEVAEGKKTLEQIKILFEQAEQHKQQPPTRDLDRDRGLGLKRYSIGATLCVSLG